MTPQQAAQKVIRQEQSNDRYSTWAFISSLWMMVAFAFTIAGGYSPVLSWGAGFCISIVNLALLIPNKGPRAARIVMAIVLAINLSPIISMAAVKIARDAGFLTYVRVKQKDGTWKLVAKRYAAPYMRD